MKSLIPVFLLVGCTPSVEEARESAGDAYCDRAEECGWNEGEEGREDCIDLAQEFLEALWPTDECEDQINREEWGECLDGIAAIDCDSWDLGITDLYKFCETDDVCDG